jgi:hypothetical protein
VWAQLSMFPSIAISAIKWIPYVEDCHASAPCKRFIPVKTTRKATILDF